MAITPNREALKSLANFAIDAQFCQQYGTQAFNYSGEVTPAYPQLCATLSEIISDVATHMAAIKSHIPVTGADEASG